MKIKEEKVKIGKITKSGYFFTDNELFSFVNSAMQMKAEFDKVDYTPAYEVRMFIEDCKKKNE